MAQRGTLVRRFLLSRSAPPPASQCRSSVGHKNPCRERCQTQELPLPLPGWLPLLSPADNTREPFRDVVPRLEDRLRPSCPSAIPFSGFRPSSLVRPRSARKSLVQHRPAPH